MAEADNLKMPIAAWQVTLDGTDLTETMAPRLLSLSIAEKRGDEADQLDITLHDADGRLEIPKKGAVLKVQLGWKQGTGLPIGLIDKGSFTVDEANWSGNPDTITLRARSADMTGAIRVRRERSFVGKTIQEVVSAIASANGLTPSVEQALGAKTIPALGSGAKSDAALLRALGKRFDAVATIKTGTLIFAPIGSGKTASGKALAEETIDRGQTDGSGDYSRIDQNDTAGVSARWHDKSSGTRKSVTVDGKGEGKAKRLRKVYASEEDAKQAARSESSRLARQVAKMTTKLTYGRPDIFPERPIALTGFKSEIDARKWVVSECTHTMDGEGGLSTSLTMEAKA